MSSSFGRKRLWLLPTQAFPEVAGGSAFLLGLFLLTAFHFWLAVVLPPTEDELYYWTWSQHLQSSYFDHPPLVAYLLALSTKLFGDTLFAIRVFPCVVSAAVLLVIARFAPGKDLLNLVLLTPLFFLGSVLMTPDAPLLLFWILYAYWLTGVDETLAHWHADPVTRVYRHKPVGFLRWILGGVLLGLGGLSKYTMVVAVPCSLLVLLTTAHARAWWRGYLGHLVIAGILCSPVLVFNHQHDYGPFLFQWHHAMGSQGLSLKYFFDFLGAQVALVGLLPFLMLPWVISRRRDLCLNPKLHVCFFFFIFPLTFFLWKALRTRLEANWSLVTYLTFWPLAQHLLARNSFKAAGRFLVVISFLIPLATSSLLLVHAFWPLKWIAPAHDRLGDIRAKEALSTTVAEEIRARALDREGPIFCPTYQWTSWFRFRKLPSAQLFPESRPSHFTMPALDPCRQTAALVWEEAGSSRVALKCFPRREVLLQHPLEVRGTRVATYLLTRYSR